MHALRNHLSVIVLAFLAAVVVAGIYTFNHVRNEAYHQAELSLEQQIKTFWELVYAKGDQFRVQNNKLLIGSYEVNGNYELPDKVKAIFGGTATIFMGDTRVSTNVPRDDGSRAVGTKLVGPAYEAVLRHGVPYRGEVAILGKPYLTAYDPIRNTRGEVIGVLYVGVEKGIFLHHFNQLFIIFLAPVMFLAVVTMVLYRMLLSQGRRADQLQKRNLRFLQALIDTLPTPVFYKDSQGHYLGCNLAFESMFKLPRTDVIGKTAYDIVPPELAAEYVEHDRQLMAAPLGATHQYESRIRNSEGVERDVIFYKARFEDDSDSACAIIGTLLDITERKQTELREHARADILEHIAKDATLQEVLASIALEVEQEQPEVICSIMLVNEAGTKLLSGAAPTLSEKYLAGMPETVIEDGGCCCATAAFSRKRVISSDIAAIRNCRRASACGLKSCWAEPILSSKGELLGTLALYSKRVWEPGPEDIRLIVSSANYASIAIERINTLKALRESERNYRELVENANSIILRMDTTGRITFFNEFAQQLFGYKGDELLGQSVLGTIFVDTDENRQTVLTVIANILEIPELYTLIETENKRKNGDQIYISWSNKACLAADGSLEEILCIGQDITERKNMQQVMVQTEKMMTVGGLAAGMAHELNNPIGTIAQHTQNILRRISTRLPANTAAAVETGVSLPNLRAYLERRGIVGMLEAIGSSCERAATIIANMLTFSRKSSIQAEFVSLAVLVEKSIDLALCDYDLKKHYDFKNVTVVREYVPDCPLVQVVPMEIEQVLLNLLKNAAQALAAHPPAAGPMITVRLYYDDSSVCVEVEDNGPGIDKDRRARIFEPFYTTKEVGVGTGLGLSVSYAIIVNRHRGSITVDSPPGKGACFTVRLPRSSTAPAA
ncbi:PAS domain S-box protein [Trichlorobacter lovleyi]|uniref:PAS domain S-box protein n=1 Tax=Trichlorobacter lovleyi TaxID=313985 RepID=UPI00223FF1FB|nr:PAS domain S-box protein [Trichlorobacter lovleyi]QOX79903.1 PAS domain S-box protein [Trichlorobacter lovleyi]